MKKFLTICIALLASISTYAQNDSLSFAQAQWSSEKVCEGVLLRQASFHGNIFNSDQNISVLEISGRKVDIIETAGTTLERTTTLAKEYGAVAAINGGFFRMRNPFGSVMYLRIDGEKKDGNLPDGSKNGSRSTRQSGAVATRNGNLYILKADCVKNWEDYIDAEDVLTSGPIMLCDGKDEFIPKVSFNTLRHPRTAVGRKADGTVVMVVVDGRSKGNADGMSIVELQSVMRWLGCSDALNLDGGGSSAMVVNDTVVNCPSDNKKFDNEGERRVSNILVVR